MLPRHLLTCLGLLLGLTVHTAHAQKFVERMADRFTFDLADSVAVRNGSYPSTLIVAPIIAYRPISGLGFGAGTQLLFKPRGAEEDTRVSQIGAAGIYTLESQILVTSTYYVFFPQETWLLAGAFEFRDFPTVYYGIGNESRRADEGEISLIGMEADPILFRRLFSNLYAGVGIHYNYMWDVTIDAEGESRPAAGRDNIAIDNFTAAGLQLALNWDSRDNINNPSEGYYARLQHNLYEEAAGGTQSFRTLLANVRHYFRPWGRRADVIAMEVHGRFSWGEEIPVPELSSLGGAYRLRGYEAGRYVDQHSLMAQVEYRMPIKDRIGTTFFFGAGDVFSDTDDLDTSLLKYSAGAGLRLMLDKKERLNVRLDYALGFGHESDSGFYVAIAETF